MRTVTRLFKRHAIRLLLSTAILVFFILHIVGHGSPLERQFINELELDFYDLRLNWTMPNTQNNEIVIVDIDEKSLAQIGRWPWNRQVMATLVNRLFEQYNIDILGMDIVFSEPDNSSGLQVLEKLSQQQLKGNMEFKNALEKLQPQLNFDEIFAQSLKDRRVVLGYTFTTDSEGDSALVAANTLPPPLFDSHFVQQNNLRYQDASGFVANLPQFQANAIATGHFTNSPDADGIVRRIPLLYGYQGALYESLTLAMARILLGVPTVDLGVQTSDSGYYNVEYLQVGNHRIPVDPYLRALVPFRGKQHSFLYVSAVDVLNNTVDISVLKNKIVLIGTSAQGLLDLRATPVATTYAGVEIHANLIAGILQQVVMDNPAYIIGVELTLLILVGLIMMSLIPLFSPLFATIGTLGLLALIVWFNLYLWQTYYLVLPLASTVLLILAQFLFNMSYGYFLETSNKMKLAGLFGQYIPRELVNEMSHNLDAEFSMEGESREMTVLFSDVRGFTTISEGLDPRALSKLMNDFLTPMTQIIHEQRGTIDKYMGDAIMAFWGAPLCDSRHALHAIEAALAMVHRLESLQAEFKAKGYPPIKIGVGLSSGIMNVGNMGSSFRMAYTVMGDTVNLGSRLEGITKQYGVQIIVSDVTYKSVPEYLFRELDCVRVKGKDAPVSIYEPICPRMNATEAQIAELFDYDKALKSYRHQQWEMARLQFEHLHAAYPNRYLYQLYLERISYFTHNPPSADWDGVYTFTTK